jgi:hypothetical protein
MLAALVVVGAFVGFDITVGLGLAGREAAATLLVQASAVAAAGVFALSSSNPSWAAGPSGWPRRPSRGWLQAHDRHRLGGRPAKEVAAPEHRDRSP